MVRASTIINSICAKLGYTRAHVSAMLRRNASRLGAKKSGRTWLLRDASAGEQLKKIVRRESGRRYRKGEKGPHAR